MNPHLPWQHGWWQHAQHIPSPNYQARPIGEIPTLVVLHNISLPPFEYGSDAVTRLFTNAIEPDAHPFFPQLAQLRVSAHFFVSRQGKVVQYVSCNDMAHHAGASHFKERGACNPYSIGIELEGCDFEPFDAKQYPVLVRLLHDIAQAYPIDVITGHEYIAPQRKTDPGHFFEWGILEKEGFSIQR